MAKVLVIADDFTGALDTAIQFSKYGLETVAYTSGKAFLERGAGSEQVCVVNTDTRHSRSADAYTAVHSIAAASCASGVRCIYKKTDSALRGNVGKELEAVLDAAGGGTLYFAPAYPKNQRFTRDGVQYYRELPISEAEYGHDPIEPMTCSDIAQIVAQQSTVPVLRHPADTEDFAEFILLWDAENERHLDTVCSAALAQQARPVLLAGCAGLAEHLAQHIGTEQTVHRTLPTVSKVLLVSGSLNPTSMAQMAWAKSKGCPCISLRETAELTTAFQETPDYDALICRAKDMLAQHGVLLLEPTAAMDEDSCRRRRTAEDCKAPAAAIGSITRDILVDEEDYSLVVFGGDTLQAVTDRLFCGEIEPLLEIRTGIPLSLAVDRQGREHVIVTKSGGFGDENVIETICEYLESEGSI